jgi:acyl dehydratase
VGPGFTVRFSRTFTREDVEAFGWITRDYNPVHFEPRFAAVKGMAGLICHGLLVGSMICEPGGQLAWLASAMEFRFLKPVFVGDTVTCEMTIVEVDPRGRSSAKATFTNQRGEVVMRAQLNGLLPGPAEQEVLTRMLAEGDPTNPLSQPEPQEPRP